MSFLNQFNPFRGDVLYGRTEARTDYLEAFMKSRQLKQLEQRAGEKFTIYRSGYYINDYNETITKGDLSIPSEPKLFSNSRALDHYRMLLQKSKYNPASVAKADWKAYAKGDNTIQSDSLRTREEWTDLAQVLAVRKACKFGIEYISSMRNAYVHYALDGISIAEVIGKADRNLWTGKQGVPITTSELRYLFREWGRYRKEVKLIFYLLQNETNAPWVTSPDEWLPYAIARVDKYRGQLTNSNPGQLKNFDKQVQANQPRQALDWFHDMKVGLT